MGNSTFNIGDIVSWTGADGTVKQGVLYAAWGGRAHVQVRENGRFRSYKMDMSRLKHV